jgi:type I restriction enzyme S subunit
MTSVQRVPFSEFLRPNSRPHTLASDQDANLVGMRWYGGGPFHRELKLAHRIQKKSHFVIRAGDVIYNKLFAWKGSFGVVPDELEGMYVSDKFPTYQPDLVKIEPRYLAWFFKHHDIWEQARKKSTGSAAISKLTLNPPQFLELDIPLPGLGKQNDVADRLDSCARNIEEARRLRADALQKIDQIVQSASSALLSRYDSEAQLGRVLLRMPRNGWSPKCDNLENGAAVLTLTAVTGWHYNPAAFKGTSLPTDERAH